MESKPNFLGIHSAWMVHYRVDSGGTKVGLIPLVLRAEKKLRGEFG